MVVRQGLVGVGQCQLGDLLAPGQVMLPVTEHLRLDDWDCEKNRFILINFYFFNLRILTIL
jgi:hypothetical protein